jgi:NADH dehydrogenase FAD-containing subunit
MPIRSGPSCSTVCPIDRVQAVLIGTGIETAAFKGQSEEEIDRLMHMVVVGGGPTGVEYAGELHDFLIVSALPLRSSYPTDLPG